MTHRSKSLVALLAALCAFAAWAVEPSPAATFEVEQLLARLAASGCKFQRNGSWHSATDARAHLEKKYRYLLDKRLVGTSEDFISMAATKSSTSGTPYRVQCGTQEPMPSAVWLTARLGEVRATKSP
jgi:hypothetical protein